MVEKIKEKVGVVVIFDPQRAVPLPWRIRWRNRYYTITKVDFCHPVWEGKTLYHIYSVCDGNTFFRLAFNTKTQQWTLEEISDGNPD
jgi:hypothetical protein